VAEYRDNWTPNPLYRRTAPIQALLRRLERWLLRRAGAVVVVSDEARAEMAAAFPFIEGRIVVAPNGFDPDDLPPETGRPATFEIAYAGSLHRRRDPSGLFAVLGRLAAAREDVRRDLRLRLMGNIPRWVVDAAEAALGRDAVSADGILPHREALLRAGQAAVLLVVSSRAEAGSAAMTSKFLEYLGLRRPILLLAPEGAARRLLADLGVGLAADPTDEPAIEAAVVALYEEWAADRERRADPATLAGFTRRATAERFARALDVAATTDQRPRRSAAMRSAASAAPADADQR
jgi:glycosyltransferase involved in cell wall biosynthesis